MAEPVPSSSAPSPKIVAVADFLNSNNLAEWQRTAFLASSRLGLDDSASEEQLHKLLQTALHGRI